jgi:galactokinase
MKDRTKASRVREKIRSGEFDQTFSRMYWPNKEALLTQRGRYIGAIDSFEKNYGEDRDIALYSTPGRVEICGNHTDHNNGVVMAAAVNLDIIAVVSRSDDNVIRVRSKNFGEDVVSLSDLKPDAAEFGKSSAMIRGVAAGIAERGGEIGGIDAYTVSDVLKGSGLSSSAAFEVCIGAILNGERNNKRFSAVEIGQIGQYAENVFFGKPSGLMDQISCSVGAAVSIDLKNLAAPAVTRIPFDLSSYGMKLVVTDTKGDHSDLTEEYSAIRGEMEQVAHFFGKKNLREVDRRDFYGSVASIRRNASDRAVLRASHFFEECGRVGKAIDAIAAGDIARFLSIITECGHSSFEFNQNAYCAKNPNRQEIPVALAISQVILEGRGAWRLQGGGFAGTIQAFVPDDLLDGYCLAMRNIFGEDACHILKVREDGALNVTES